MLVKFIRSYYPVSVLAGLLACGAKQQQPRGLPPAIPVTVDTVKSTDAVYYDEYPGIIVAINQTDIRAQVAGYITNIFFKDGQEVTKGQKLYSIDQQLYNANYQQALANLQVQQTNLIKAQKDADRYHDLDKQDAIAKQQVDYADAALETAKKQVAAAQANADAVKSNLNFSTITAPFSGTIGISQVRIGTSVVAGQTVLNTISTDNPMAVDFSVDQNEVYRFSKLLQERQHANDSTFSIVFGTDIYPSHGTISLIDRAVDPQTGTIKTRLIFPNSKNLLKAGMTTKVRVLNNASKKAIIIPYKAITEQLGEFFVYVVGDSSKVSQRKVVLGQALGASVIVKDGLTPGEIIAVQGVQNLREGATISIAKPATNPAAHKN
ncbi:MAG: efflux RND transporter periplasmic adaptor subunit [Bacteroidetes bacterium]|nr:efflux RND transporter periplasmic adaptor subunit [Bacteroidota bacterium]MBS1930029.1 efflux RND transporter periplasmic adaptor subunit [Bacteroidota bacterium]